MTRRSRLRKTRRHYAVLGYIAQHGPCPAAEIAAELGYPLPGLAVDLVVQKVIWHQVCSDGSDPRQPLYRLPDAASHLQEKD